MYHALMADLGGRDDPDDLQAGVLHCQPLPELIHIFRVPYFAGKRSINQDNIVIIQRLHGNINDSLIFIIANIGFKKVGTPVAFLTCHIENAVRQDDQGIFVQIDDVLQIFCQLFRDVGFPACRR